MDQTTAAGTRPALTYLVGWGIMLAWPIFGGAILGMSIALFASQPSWHDPTWYLYAAGRLLNGADIYRTEIFEVNPPLIIWISTIPVALGHVLNVAPFLMLKLDAGRRDRRFDRVVLEHCAPLRQFPV